MNEDTIDSDDNDPIETGCGDPYCCICGWLEFPSEDNLDEDR